MSLFILLVLVLVIGLLALGGLFTGVSVKTATLEPMVLVYTVHCGDYAKTKEPMDALYFKLQSVEKIDTYRGFGLYYDNPAMVEKAKLRCLVGCILEKKDEERLNDLRSKGYKAASIMKQESYVADYPYTHPLSPLLGVIKVYPIIQKFSRENSLQPKPIMEIYDMPGKKISYILNNNADESELLKLLD